MANMTLPYVADSDGNYTFSATATPIQIIDLAASILEAKLAGEALTDPSATERFLQLRLASLEHEVFACIFLDNRHRVIAFQELFSLEHEVFACIFLDNRHRVIAFQELRGTISCAAVYPREIVKAALGHNAAAVILAHNHPSGIPEPSSADRSLTRCLKDALGIVDVQVLDHIVVGHEGTVSFAARGWL